MLDLDVFIEGELMDLCIPTRAFSSSPDWYSMFNDPKITRYTYRGLFPNTKENQEEYFNENNSELLILIIVDKKENFIGVISLSYIDFMRRKCDVSLVLNSSKFSRLLPYISLEAMARICEHAFLVMGIDRIEAGQHIELSGWQQRMELLGFRVEGLHRNKFVKGRDVSDTVSIACTFESYNKICSSRGSLWDNYTEMKRRYAMLPKAKFIDLLSDFHETVGEEYYNKIISL